MGKLTNLLLMTAIAAGCVGPGPERPPVRPQPGVTYKAVKSEQGDMIVWSRDQSFLLLQGSAKARIHEAALAELRKKSLACQNPPCGEPLQAQTIENINEALARHTETRIELGGHPVWVSIAEDLFLVRGQGQDWLYQNLDKLDKLIRMVPCAPPAFAVVSDCVPPVLPPPPPPPPPVRPPIDLERPFVPLPQPSSDIARPYE